MKIQKLTIHNIASVEDAVIDFESQPLADSDIFLITGKTGSGKSTILDAICLALYADTPRLTNCKMGGKVEDAGKSDSLTLKDPRQLLRRNEAEAYVTLTFIGKNEISYEATWSVRRANNKVSGKLQSKSWILKNITRGITLTKDAEIQDEIKSAIGLDFNQFCRTTLLAQGEFTRFLNSNNNEKAEILEKITGVDIYSQIGKQIYIITSEKREAYNTINKQVDNIHILTEDEITAKKDLLNTLEEEYKIIKKLTENESLKLEWLKTDINLKEEERSSCESLQEAKQLLEEPHFKQKEKLVQEWQETIDARDSLEKISKAKTIQQTQEEILRTLAEEFQRLLGGYKYELTQLTAIKSSIEKIDTYFENEQENKTIYENAQTIKTLLLNIADDYAIIEAKSKIIGNNRKSLTDNLLPLHQEAIRKVEEVKKEYALKAEELNTAKKELEDINLPQLRVAYAQVSDLLNKIAIAKERIENLEQEKKRIENLKKRLATQELSIIEKKKQSADMDTPLREADLIMKERKATLDKQKDTVDKFAKTLRSKLTIGDVCPLCQQKIVSEIPHEDTLSALVDGFIIAYEEAENNYNQLREVKLKIDAEIKSAIESYNRDKQLLEADKSVEEATQKVINGCKDCGVETLNDTTLSILNNLQETNNTKKIDLEIKISIGETKEKEVQKIQTTLNTMRDNVDKLNNKVLEAEHRIAQENTTIEKEEGIVKIKRGEVEEDKTKVQEYLPLIKWGIDWSLQPQEFVVKLNSEYNKYNTTLNEREELQSQSHKLETICGNVKTILAKIQELNPLLQTYNPIDVVKIEDLENDTRALATNITTALGNLKIAEGMIKESSEELEKYLSSHPSITKERVIELNTYTSDNINAETESIKKVRENFVAIEAQYKMLKQQIETHLKKCPQLSDEETIELIVQRMAEQESNSVKIVETKVSIEQELKNNEEQNQELKKLLDEKEAKRIEYENWSKIDNLLGDAIGNKFRQIAQSYILSNLVHSANNYMRSLTDRYLLKVEPGTFVIMLQDAYQGYLSRAASTISGGESFLVSLSLALALSDIGTTLSVDTLFIDEGFGTLSGDALQNVIDTLRTLHIKAGRHVGIISHVEALRECVPVQIQVIQEGTNSSSTIKVVS
ncbi:MAG: AAA family ATPase [Bacteroidales bacterium]|nr:AAA family ATPase [Bacteroidales bacterium]